MSGAKVATAQPHSYHSGALSFMSCTSGRESSPMDENDSHQTTEFKTETKKKRFHPLRNLRRMFRRKSRRSSISADSYQVGVPDNPEIPSNNLEQRSCSTSRLQEENLTQNLMRNSRLNPGLSLSHDSIFTPDRADSGLSSSDLENSSLSITILTPPSKEHPTKSQSSCSETSLLSIGSSEVELSPVRSSKTSDLDLGVTTYKLSHSAAKHKMAVKPRRNHGAPRSRRRTMVQQERALLMSEEAEHYMSPVLRDNHQQTKTSKSCLPTTIEVSEEGAAGRSSPSQELSSVDVFSLESCSGCDKKTTWSSIVLEAGHGEEKTNEGQAKPEDDWDGKEEEGTGGKTESFFGRFLSRRSEKKKKLHAAEVASASEDGDEKANHFAKKFTKAGEGKVGAGKIPNRRQRMEPVEIPSGGHDKDSGSARKISGSFSPPKTYWPSQAMTSRSISPPKVIWPENFSCYVKTGEEETTTTTTTSGWDRTKRERTDATPTKEPTEIVPKDLKNPDFVKELTDSVSVFAKDETGKRKKEEEDGESKNKSQQQQSEAEKTWKPSITARKISNSSESIGSLKSSDGETTTRTESTANYEEPRYMNLRLVNQYPYDAIHDGYENVQIIELVKQETRISEAEDKQEVTAEVDKGGFLKKEREALEKSEKDVETVKKTEVEAVKKSEPEVVMRRTKPLVSEKPKDLKRTGTPEFMKVSLNRVEPKTSEGETKVVPKARTTLIERRKSELMLLTESEEKKERKAVKKQTSFSEPSPGPEKQSGGEGTAVEAVAPLKDDEPLPDKTEEIVEEVVLRKKSTTVDSSRDEQPELMKVFARRSLKVRESEKIVEDMQRSRDSDKENEMTESPKEDRKKSGNGDTGEKDKKEGESVASKEGNRIASKVKAGHEVKVNITPLKPEVASRKCVFQRYGRSLSENNGKAKEEMDYKTPQHVLEENKANKMRNVTEVTVSSKLLGKEERGGGGGLEGEEEEGEETGFKRIQQRKAEWERRAQQGAK